MQAAAGNPALATLVHERQVLEEEWRERDRQPNAELSEALEKHDTEAEAANMGRLKAIDARIKVIDEELAAKFPEYEELVSPAPITVEEIQALLGDDEALVLILDTGELGPARCLARRVRFGRQSRPCSGAIARRRSPSSPG